jgi:putative DNA primase/helicase
MFKKAVIFVGSGDTGKTTLLEVVTHLLGRDNISSISLQKMTGDKFSAAHLYEKHGNLVDELSARDISDTGAFKMATGGGSVTGEYKFGNQFNFHNFSKFTFACNRIPDVGDTNDEAYFNRWMVIRFENTITNKIPNFIETVSTEEERSGLFNLAMRGLERLIEQKQFSYNYTAEETRVEMMRSGSSIAMFASSMLERADGAEVTKEDMYDAYVDYCKKNKMSTQTKDMLGKKLCDYTNFLSEGMSVGLTAKGNPGKVRVWRNAKIRGGPVENKADKDFNEF